MYDTGGANLKSPIAVFESKSASLSRLQLNKFNKLTKQKTKQKTKRQNNVRGLAKGIPRYTSCPALVTLIPVISMGWPPEVSG